MVMLLSELCDRSSEINSIINNKAKLKLELLRVKSLEFICFILLVDKISFSFLRVSLIFVVNDQNCFCGLDPKPI